MGRVGSAAEHGRIQGRGWPNTCRSNTAWPSALPPHLPSRGEVGRGNQVRVPRAGFSHELVDEDEEQKACALRGQAPYLRRCRGNTGAKAGPRSLCSPAEAPRGVRPSESGVGCGRKPNPVPDQGAAGGGGPANVRSRSNTRRGHGHRARGPAGANSEPIPPAGTQTAPGARSRAPPAGFRRRG